MTNILYQGSICNNLLLVNRSQIGSGHLSFSKKVCDEIFRPQISKREILSQTFLEKMTNVHFRFKNESLKVNSCRLNPAIYRIFVTFSQKDSDQIFAQK